MDVSFLSDPNMFRYRQGRQLVDNSIWESIQSLEGLDTNDKRVIYTEVMGGLDQDIKIFEDDLTIPEQSGPSLWDFLHWMGKVADEEKNPSVYRDAISVLERGHPCASMCRKHLVDNMKLLPISGYTSMFLHSFDLHNLVNKQLGKRNFSLQQAKKMYDIDCVSCVFGAHPNAGSMH
jgi:hypothetical protein